MAHGHRLSQQQLDGLKRFIEKTREELTCNICLDYFEDPVTTRCDHQFCRKCIVKCMTHVNLFCPICKSKISKRSLVSQDTLAAVVRVCKEISSEVENSEEFCAEAVDAPNVEMKTKMKIPVKPVIAENPREVPRNGPCGLTLLTQLDNEFRVKQQQQHQQVARTISLGSPTLSLENSTDSVKMLPHNENEPVGDSECLLSASQVVTVVPFSAQAKVNRERFLPKEELPLAAKMEKWFTSCGKHLLDCDNPMVELDDNRENSEPVAPGPSAQQKRLFKSRNGEPLPDEAMVIENLDEQRAADPYLFVSSQKTPQKRRKRLSADQQLLSYSRVDLKRHFKLKAYDPNIKNEQSNKPRVKKAAKECSDSNTEDSFPIAVGDAFDELVAAGSLRHFPTVDKVNCTKMRTSSSSSSLSESDFQRTVILFCSPNHSNDDVRRTKGKKENVGASGQKRNLKDAFAPLGRPKNVKRVKIAATEATAAALEAGAEEPDPIPSTSKQTERTVVVIPPTVEQNKTNNLVDENTNLDVLHNSIKGKSRPTSVATTVIWPYCETPKGDRSVSSRKLNVEFGNKEGQTSGVSAVVGQINAEVTTADTVFVPGEEIPVQLREAVVEPRETVFSQPFEEFPAETCEKIVTVCHQTSGEPSPKPSSFNSPTTECHPLNLSITAGDAHQAAESSSVQYGENVLQATQALDLSKKDNRECNEELFRMVRNTHSDWKDVRNAEQEEEEEEEEEEISFLTRIKLRRSLTSARKSCRPKVKFYLHESMRRMTVVTSVSSKACQTDSSVTLMSGLECVCRLSTAASPLAQVNTTAEQNSVPVESEDCVVQVASESWGETQLPFTENLPMQTDNRPDETEVEHKSEQPLSMQEDVPEKIAVEKIENINLLSERSHVCVTPIVDTKSSSLKDSDKVVYSPSPVRRSAKRCFINDLMVAAVVVSKPLVPLEDLPGNSHPEQDSEEKVVMSSLKKSILRSKIMRMRNQVLSGESMEEAKQSEPLKESRGKFKRIVVAASSDTEFSIHEFNMSDKEAPISQRTSDDDSDFEFSASSNGIEQAVKVVLPQTEEGFDDCTPSLLEVVGASDSEMSFDYVSSPTALTRVKENFKRDLEMLQKEHGVGSGDVLQTNVNTLDLGLSGNTRAAECVQAKEEQCAETKQFKGKCVATDINNEVDEPDLFPESITERNETSQVSDGIEENIQDDGYGMMDLSSITQFPYSDLSTETEYLNTQSCKQLEREIIAKKATLKLMEKELKAESARHDAALRCNDAGGSDFPLVDCLNNVASIQKLETPLLPSMATVPIEQSPLSTVPAVKDRVFVISGLSSTEQANVKTMAVMFNCKLADVVTENTTHLIIKTDEKRVCSRTFKYLMGIACHCYIVSYDWVNACVTSGDFVSEDEYEVVGDYSTPSAFHSGPRNSRLSASPLFKNHEIHSIGLINGINKDDWFQLLTISGATHITDPSLFSYMKNRKSYILVTHNSDVDEDYNKLYQRYRVPVLDQDWILNSLAAFKLNTIDHYLLTSNGI